MVLVLLFGLLSIVMADDCPSLCPFIYAPVCATIKNFEGESVACTFPNHCMLSVFTCRTKQESVMKQGPCREKNEGCYEIIKGF
ncbi:hypothetical protein CVS40_9967 [Lucilia cuprina]|nr:hypothetical protein CVS40_9967 [Lucilia cuprina]